MGQKTHPIGFRIGVVRTWSSKWFENSRYRQWLHEDILLRRFLKKELYAASIADITMERAANKLKINIFSARPGIIIGKRGAGVEQLKKKVQKFTGSEVFLNIQEVRKAGLYRHLWQVFGVLLPVHTVGVMGDARTYENALAIRAVTSTDAMTADWARLPYDLLDTMSRRIINEVRGINRVCYDISSKPPAKIEWE